MRGRPQGTVGPDRDRTWTGTGRLRDRDRSETGHSQRRLVCPAESSLVVGAVTEARRWKTEQRRISEGMCHLSGPQAVCHTNFPGRGFGIRRQAELAERS